MLKLLIIVLGGIALLVACIVAIGLLLPKHHVASRSALFRAPQDKLFALVAGPQTWRPDVASEEAIPAADGRELRKENTRDGESITYELLDPVPPRSVKRRIATENLPYSGTWTFSLEPASGSTVVRITEDGEVSNPAFRFVSRFVMGYTKSLDTYLRALGKATGEEVAVRD